MTRSGPFRHILCPVDFSDHSRQALRYAALLVSRTGARLTVTFVQDPLLAAAAKGTTAATAARTELRRFVERTVAPDRLSTRSIAFHMAAGKPFREIQRAAAGFRCDLIVVGSHGATGVRKMVLGSTTDQLLHQALVPILAVPPSDRRTSRGPARRWPEGLAIVPLDLGRHSSKDIAAAVKIANGLSTQLLLLHVAPRGNKRLLVKASARLEKLRAAAKSPAIVDCVVLTGNPVDQIAEHAASENVELVILTRRRGPGLFGARLGSISYAVLCEGNTPVLALPAPGALL